jgi:biofilm PGA synthesis N-glycosyltransferase PgaC
MIITTALILGLYLLILIPLWIGHDSLEKFTPRKNEPKEAFSVIIPFRDEAEQLPFLLKSIIDLNYPFHLFEIIFVDDDSKDDSADLIREALSNTDIEFKIIPNEYRSRAPKKDAIRTGINTSAHDWILTTDADCIVPPFWLYNLSGFIQERDPVLVAGPVDVYSNKSLLHSFQRLDMWSLQLTAMGSFGLGTPILCNGANLAYKKEAFIAVNGFTDNDHIASGDDVFLLQKLKKKYPKELFYIKSTDSVVCTRPEETWNKVIIQRIRWASKLTGIKNRGTIIVGSIVFVTNLLMLLIPVLFLLAPQKWLAFLLFFVIKLVVDGLYLNNACKFFKGENLTGEFLVSFLIYPMITCVVVFGSIFGKYSWKGRTFKKQT